MKKAAHVLSLLRKKDREFMEANKTEGLMDVKRDQERYKVFGHVRMLKKLFAMVDGFLAKAKFTDPVTKKTYLINAPADFSNYRNQLNSEEKDSPQQKFIMLWHFIEAYAKRVAEVSQASSIPLIIRSEILSNKEMSNYVQTLSSQEFKPREMPPIEFKEVASEKHSSKIFKLPPITEKKESAYEGSLKPKTLQQYRRLGPGTKEKKLRSYKGRDDLTKRPRKPK